MLKKRHFLHGTNLLPRIMRFKYADIDSFDDELARLKEEHSLDKCSLEELEAEFHLLCGERAVNMCILAAKHGDKESVMVLMNLAIHLANEIGAPTLSSIPLQAVYLNTPQSGHAASDKRTATATSPNSTYKSLCSELGATVIESTKFIPKVSAMHYWDDVKSRMCTSVSPA